MSSTSNNTSLTYWHTQHSRLHTLHMNVQLHMSSSFPSLRSSRKIQMHTHTLEGLDLEEAFHVLPPSGDVLFAGHKPVRVSGQRISPCQKETTTTTTAAGAASGMRRNQDQQWGKIDSVQVHTPEKKKRKRKRQKYQKTRKSPNSPQTLETLKMSLKLATST